jgi:hypothetical protein
MRLRSAKILERFGNFLEKHVSGSALKSASGVIKTGFCERTITPLDGQV